MVTACTSGTHNIGLGARLIAQGDADAMLVGGAEMATTPVGLGGFAAARALSTRNDDPEAASRPWDADRDGFVLGDGAGVKMLEEYEIAKARGAKIYAEVLGFGMSGDAYHMTLPPEDGRGAAASMTNAIRDAGVPVDQINYITRVTQPTLMLNGEYDFFFPVATSQKPMYELLGTPEADKEYKVYPGAHSVPRTERTKETLIWLDRYLGPVE